MVWLPFSLPYQWSEQDIGDDFFPPISFPSSPLKSLSMCTVVQGFGPYEMVNMGEWFQVVSHIRNRALAPSANYAFVFVN